MPPDGAFGSAGRHLAIFPLVIIPASCMAARLSDIINHRDAIAMFELRNLAVFSAAIGLGTVLVIAATSLLPAQAPLPVHSMQLTARIAVAGQLTPNQVAELKSRGFGTVVVMLPDGEEAGQPASADMHAAARDERMAFAYVPLPKGDIVPDAAVVALVHALDEHPEPVMLYCRDGRRAARAWSLLEASRPGGANAASILAAVRASGHSADDLAGHIARRIARRELLLAAS